MEPLTIKTPADVLSFIGHTLGFWPHESLVCITLDANRVGQRSELTFPTARADSDTLAQSLTTSPTTPAPPACSSPCTPPSARNPGSPNRTQQPSQPWRARWPSAECPSEMDSSSEARPIHSTTAIPETTSSCSERNGSSSSRSTKTAAARVEKSGADKTIAPGRPSRQIRMVAGALHEDARPIMAFR
jgi:hypothetical protein